MDSYSHGLLFKYLTVLEKRKNKIPNLQMNLNKVYEAKLDFPHPPALSTTTGEATLPKRLLAMHLMEEACRSALYLVRGVTAPQ